MLAAGGGQGVAARRARRLAGLISILSCLSAHAADPAWIAMQNEHFQVFSSASERDTRRMLGQFERVRGFFYQASQSATTTSGPVTVLIFGTAQEYQPYRFNSAADAYYTKHGDRDFIVMGGVEEQSSMTASHEYTHLVFDHSGYDLPPWLSEGIAEMFSTLRAHGEATEFGEIIPGRLYGMNRGQWVPLETILAVDHDSPWYNEADKADSFYNESWALVHMLMTRDQYRNKFWQVLSAVDKGTPSARALESAYGMPLAQLDSNLRWYVSGNGNQFKMLKINMPLPPVDKVAGNPADMFEVRTLQAELLVGLKGRHDEARQRLEALVHEDPTRPGPWADLGYLALYGDHVDEAAEKFGRAFDLGDRNPRLIMDLAHAFQETKPARSMEALRALLAEHPDDIDARLYLANLQMGSDRVVEAVNTTQPITTVKTAEQRDQLLYLRAFAALKLGNKAAARANAEQLRQVTTSDRYKSEAESLLRASGQ
jgi:tetratricopeptide (TPR) repeat protein